MMTRLWTFVALILVSSITSSFAQTNGSDTQGDGLSEIKTDMVNLSQNTQAGSFFPEAQVPVDLNKFRQDMLEIGNLGRRDSEYRKKHGEKVAIDLSGETTTVNGNEEKIFKHNQSPPYFNDLVLNDSLNQAAQFQAEYLAANNKPISEGHTGPADYQGQSMMNLGERVKYFGYTYNLEGEGAAMHSEPTGSPEWWMQSNSHFRPWFNIGSDVREVGLGIAKGSNGYWYAVVDSGLGR